MASSSSDQKGPVGTAIALSPPPWNTRATMYLIAFWTSAKIASDLPPKAFHPLELQSSFASPKFGNPTGGLSMIQLIRYHDTPVGPYDEMILSPGSFEYPDPSSSPASSSKTKKKAMRITRIYVSQEKTCFNGRKLWNIPKHLARFEWVDDPSSGATTIKVYPHDTAATPYDPKESSPSDAPFFQCTLKAVPYLPSIPFSTSLLKTIGMDYTIVQPPLPEGTQAASNELPGTGDEWTRLSDFVQHSKQTSVVWADLSQKDKSSGIAPDQYENFWPGLGRWHLALKMDNGQADFGHGVKWTTPSYLL
ncbi:hypothetical protein QBC35DRAFT_66477 [Podospora australis]|uniref:Acetoacetate decarboxylase n=1 Tax=Podospora australis TaxID=1536484 RepID=A0AAN6WPT6_9PEZI|nr:hypothetical protein QBC35DRAFT_66477 [Podospora australis]